jgi:hypothetical protein
MGEEDGGKVDGGRVLREGLGENRRKWSFGKIGRILANFADWIGKFGSKHMARNRRQIPIRGWVAERMK